MPETQIDRRLAKGFLLVLLPAALLVSFIFIAWPYILGGLLLIIVGNAWQSYQWSKTARAIEPIFRSIIAQSRGEIAPIDLANRAQISGKVAQKYLAIKADEFGTGSRQDPERGSVYYFISVGNLGQIFDDSEMRLPNPLPPVATRSIVAPEPNPPVVYSAVKESPQPVKSIETLPAPITTAKPTIEEPRVEPAKVEAAIVEESKLEEPELEESTPETTPEPPTSIVAELSAPTLESTSVPETISTDHLHKMIKSDLAKRLEVQPSTLYKRRNDPDFTEWAQSRDPEGIAWGFLPETKEFYRVENP
jgi:hypothetical protein